MEEILASIRRIIADDQSFPGRPPTEPAASPAEARHEPGPDAAEIDALPAPAGLTAEDEAMHVRHESHSQEAMPHAVGSGPEIEASDAAPPEHAVHAPQFPSPAGPNLEMPLLMSEVGGAGSAAAELEAALAETIMPPPGLDETPAEPPPSIEAAAPAENLFSPAIDSSVTTAFNTLAASRLVANADQLQGLVREMIRPLLKTWIDEHLPDVVERLVMAEIERIARGGL